MMIRKFVISLCLLIAASPTWASTSAPQFPFGTSECASIRGPIGASLRRRTHRILDEEMRQLRAYHQRQDRTEPGGQERIPVQPSLPRNGQDDGTVQGLRHRSRCSAETRRRRCSGKYAVAVAVGGKGQGPDRVARHSRWIIDGGYKLGMPSVRLTIIVRLDQASSLDRMVEFVEECQTPIGTDVSVLLSAADGPAATKLFTDLGALAISFEAHATVGGIHYLVAGDGNQMSVLEAWASSPAGLDDPPRRTDGSVDANRLRQYEWHCGFLGRVRDTMSRFRA
jgi:hypothetical protein